MIRVRYRAQSGHKFQEESFDDSAYEEAQRRFGESVQHWAQVELVFIDVEDDRWDLVVLDRQGLD